MKHPLVILLGSMKAGTSSIFKALSHHPQILCSTEKEPGIFLEPKSKEEVSAYWKEPRKETCVYFEASTHYTKMPFCLDVPSHMKASGLNIKFLFSVRDPLGRAISHARFMNKHYPYKAWTILDDRVYMCSKYHYQLGFYKKVFPKSPIHLIDFNKLNQPETYHDVESFLGLNAADLPMVHLHKTRVTQEKKGLKRFLPFRENKPSLYSPSSEEIDLFFSFIKEDLLRWNNENSISLRVSL